MTRFCQHTFFVMKPLTKENAVEYAIVACLYCGQIRHIYEDGVIDIVKDEGVVKKKPNKHENGGE